MFSISLREMLLVRVFDLPVRKIPYSLVQHFRDSHISRQKLTNNISLRQSFLLN